MLFSTELVNIGQEKCPPGHEFGGKRNYYLLHLVLEGKGEFYSNNRRWSLKKGDAFLIFPNQMHLYKADIKTPWNYFWLGFKGDYSKLLNPLQIDEDHPILHYENIEELYKLFSEIQDQKLSPHPSLILNNLALLNMIFSKLIKAKASSVTKNNRVDGTIHNHVHSMECFIVENFNTPIQVQDVIDFVRLERSYASRIFKDYYNKTLGEYIRDHRLNQACNLLKEGWSAKESAYSCGYNDYHNFLKAFKKVYGVTAGRFRIDHI